MPPAGRYRWVICSLLFFATTINYIDRQVVSLLGPTLSAEFGWSDLDYSHIIFNFTLAYAIGLLAVGPLIDRLGTKLGFALAIAFWSLAAIGHAVAHLYKRARDSFDRHLGLDRVRLREPRRHRCGLQPRALRARAR